MQLAAEITVLLLAAIVMLLVLPRAPRRTRLRRSSPTPHRPADLERLEWLTVRGRYTAGDVHLRLRPVLREIAIPRLRAHGVNLDRHERAARTLLGELLWEMVRPERPRPDDMRATEITSRELESLLERLEAL